MRSSPTVRGRRGWAEFGITAAPRPNRRRYTSRVRRFALSALCVLALPAMLLPSCQTVRSDPAMATRQYPYWLKQVETLPVQVLTEGETMVIVNATTRSFDNVDVWLNERYVQHVDRIAPGENKRLAMASFWDIRGEGPNPGGLFRYYQPTPIRLVQIQTSDPAAPLIGLQAVLTEVETR
jgi:hypothetical protein